MTSARTFPRPFAPVAKSAWTAKSLYRHFSQIIEDLKVYINQRFSDQDKAVQAALLAAKEAVIKAELSAEKRADEVRDRFATVNEFRGQLADQASTFMPRSEAEIQFSNLEDKIASNTSNIDRTGGGVTAGQRMVTVLLSVAAILLSSGALIALILLH